MQGTIWDCRVVRRGGISPRCLTRMPVILLHEHHEKWLVEVADDDFKELLKPFPADRRQMWPISARVNDPKNDDEGILKPI